MHPPLLLGPFGRGQDTFKVLNQRDFTVGIVAEAFDINPPRIKIWPDKIDCSNEAYPLVTYTRV